MAAARTLAEMRTTARQLADATNQTDWVDDAELDERLNEWLQALYDKLITARGHEFYAATKAITLVSGTASYDLPANFYHLSACIANDGSVYCDMYPWQPQELAQLLSAEGGGGATSLGNYRYRLQNAQIEIRPKPSVSGHSLELRYVPSMTRLKNANDTFDGVNGWERYACLGVAIDLLNKEESDSGPLQLELTRIEARISALAGNRDAGHPHRIQDVRGDWGDSVWSVPREPLP